LQRMVRKGTVALTKARLVALFEVVFLYRHFDKSR